MTQEMVVFVHGIWMPGAEMWSIKRYLAQQHGYSGRLFSYPSVRSTLDDNARKLADFVIGMGIAKVHLVGHSLGGVVALRALATVAEMPAGRLVCLGSPLTGSEAARHLDERDWGHRILGRSITAGVIDEAASSWAGDVVEKREIGVIAGTVSVGLGKLFATFDGDNDGTVAVAETQLPGVRDHICLASNHTGLVFSKDVAEQTAAFLKRGEFLREA
ncbi:MAG: alpha/beta hydrolase [Gammaproteobacteria bacterium]|nr:alpha/beta hydrolase [Gammaproteobacteria bacterium]